MAGDNLLCGSKGSALREKKISVFAGQWYGLVLLWFRAVSVNFLRGRDAKELLCCSIPQSMLFIVSWILNPMAIMDQTEGNMW